ncbi:MAG: hypothetical protein EAZ60_16190 [Oscillatoriales cyanobacterium]|nr:MAG: hypothetical protein EAZ60_16190 [Oscillatoriales cyanobacterium]
MQYFRLKYFLGSAVWLVVGRTFFYNRRERRVRRERKDKELLNRILQIIEICYYIDINLAIYPNYKSNACIKCRCF